MQPQTSKHPTAAASLLLLCVYMLVSVVLLRTAIQQVLYAYIQPVSRCVQVLEASLADVAALTLCVSLFVPPLSLTWVTVVSSEERSTPSASDALSFLRVVGKLKGLKRTGWVHCGVSEPE